MGNKQSVAPFETTLLPPPPSGTTRVCVTGFTLSHHTGRAQQIAALLAKNQANKFESWFFFCGNDEYRGANKEGPAGGLLGTVLGWLPADSPLKSHRTSPFCWLETSSPIDGSIEVPQRPGVHVRALGGRDKLVEWVKANVNDEEVLKIATDPSVLDAWVDESPGTSQVKK